MIMLTVGVEKDVIIKTMINISKYYLNRRFIKSMKAPRALVRPNDMTKNLK